MKFWRALITVDPNCRKAGLGGCGTGIFLIGFSCVGRRVRWSTSDMGNSVTIRCQSLASNISCFQLRLLNVSSATMIRGL